ncbi:MAG TPA: hypothetical protein ENJ95_24610 [Bacteroidetes bacterium]|nr:hypothetical protein [Bacteroidota bacterium]
MKNLTLFTLLVSFIFLFSFCGSEKKEAPKNEHLGELHFRYNGNEAAMPHFAKGLKLLHNFEYDDACTEFKKAEELDPHFVMAHWGEAMTYNHPLWRQQDYEKGMAALGKLADTQEERSALAKTDLERDFLRCTEIMYGPDGTKKERDSMYSKQLERMYGKYAGNEEVAAFYALSLLGAVKVGRNTAAYEKGAKVAEGILKDNIHHPGALHYLIHSFDDPGHAPKALPAALSYSKVAADATHALHMPSHIFVAVGMWDEVVKSNIASWGASHKKALETDAKNFGSYHALHWLMYGLLQKGRFKEAQQLVSDMQQYATEKPGRSPNGYLIAMRANYLVETGEWDGDIAGIACEPNDPGIGAKYYFTEGMRAYVQKDKNKLENIIQQLKEKKETAIKFVTDEGVPMCSTSGARRGIPNQLDIDQAEVMEYELKGLWAELKGDKKMADGFYAQATDMESNINFSSGPPSIVYPSFELYGDFLLKNGNAEKAAAQYDKALQKGPKRRRALMGRLEAAKLLKDENKITELENILAEVLDNKKGEAL